MKVNLSENKSMTGNPVKCGDGCATVRGDKFPSATDLKVGKAEARLITSSQDTG